MNASFMLFGQALLVGLSIAAPVGQIGVLAIQRTLQFGMGAGFATGLGAALADAVYGAVGAFGVAAVIDWLVGARPVLAAGGAVFLVVLAWRLWHQPVATAAPGETPPTVWLRHVSTTFVLTLSNPSTIISFIAVFGMLAGPAKGAASPWLMVAGVFVGSALWWLLLASVVSRLRSRFDAVWQRRVNRLSALVLGTLAVASLAQAVSFA